jgi:hypothetical protein
MTEAGEFLTFPELVRRQLALLAKADETVRAANEARRLMLHEARRQGVNTTLLKIVSKEKTFDEEMLDELASYRDAAFEDTPLAQAARAARARAAEEATRHAAKAPGKKTQAKAEEEEAELYDEEDEGLETEPA